VTLIAAFRCSSGGVFLCADREETNSSYKRSVGKLGRLSLNNADFFIAGAGRSSILANTFERLRLTLVQADDNDVDLEANHQTLIRNVLRTIYEDFIWEKGNEGIGLIIVARFTSNFAPIIYGTDEEVLYSIPCCICEGCGRDLAYYLADRIYQPRLAGKEIVVFGTFLFREVREAVSGVGLGTDMTFISANSREFRELPYMALKEMESKLPNVGEAITKLWSSGPIEGSDWLAKAKDFL
jgi:hypothetical protein